uniref:Protein kinase domain-containing protein n=1 Tax=Panagrellus redivivus TaxID=6233 RepID=A0A7E4VT69_PANRE
MPKYGIIGRIGQGAQGVLMKARAIETGETVAVKRIHLRNDTKSHVDALREINCLRHCNHESIVKILDTFFDENTVSIVMEFVESNLKLVINDVSRPHNDVILAHYFRQIFNGVAYLHNLNIMHRDLKPENILVTQDNKIKIADFGLACVYVPNSRKTYSHQVVTRWYRAPELLFGSITYDPKVDIWACGCVLAEYINGSPLFMGYNDIDQLAIVLSVLGTPAAASWPEWELLPDAHKIVFEDSEPCSDWKKYGKRLFITYK